MRELYTNEIDGNIEKHTRIGTNEWKPNKRPEKNTSRIKLTMVQLPNCLIVFELRA
jgi:hypothetical protein